MKEKRSRFDFPRLLALLVCIGVFSFSAYKLIHYYWVEGESEDYYEALVKEVTETEEPAVQTSEPEESAVVSEKKTVDFESLAAENDEICGWLRLSGTVLNYPVARADNNEKYLHHLPNGKYSYGGTLFMDCANSADFSDGYTVIYGHNMKNKKTMFAPLVNYKKQDFYDSHPVIELTAKQGSFHLAVFAAVITDTESGYYDLPFDEEKKEAIIASAIGDSLIKTDVQVNKTDRIIALSTCEYSKSNARFIVLCKAEAAEN